MELCVSCIYLPYCLEYVWKSSLWIGIFQRAKQQARILLTDNIQSGAAVVWTVITSCHSFLLLRWNCGLFLVCFQMRVRKNWTEVFFHFLYPTLLFFLLSSAFARLCVSTLRSTNDLSHQEEEKLITNFCASRKQLIIKKYSSEIGLISTPW